ncbi:FmdB family zinc ribbon protein [Lysobacter humi (ex Lee et al. 2017)]
MPIYAFECSACGHDFDRLQKLSDPDPTDCPQCGAPQVRRRLTAPQFRLAGGGWYETDFKKDGDKKRNLAGDSAAPSSGGSESKSESKPAESKPAEARPAPKADPKPAAGKGTGRCGSGRRAVAGSASG